MFLSLGISIIGFMIECRILRNLKVNQIFSEKFYQTWLSSTSILQIIVFFLLRQSLLLILICTLIKILLPICYLYLLEIRRQRAVRLFLVPSLDFLILQVRSGRSLRESLDELLSSKSHLENYFREVRSLLQFGTEKLGSFRNSQLDLVTKEIFEVHKSSFRIVDRLKALRSKIKAEIDFRQRSRQVTSQIRIQALILSLIYLLLIGLGISEFHLLEMSSLLILSLALFVLGVCGLFYLPRTFRWRA